MTMVRTRATRHKHCNDLVRWCAIRWYRWFPDEARQCYIWFAGKATMLYLVRG